MQTSQSSVQQSVGISSAGAPASLSRAEQLQLTEERHATLGRHVVEQLNISINHFIGVAAVGLPVLYWERPPEALGEPLFWRVQLESPWALWELTPSPAPSQH